MLIRSQDRADLANIENVENIYTYTSPNNNSYPYFVSIGTPTFSDKGYVIGRYSTEEKALKVLDMIQDAYTACIYHKATLKEMYTARGSRWEFNPEFAFIPPSVFQMPQDDEVKL